MGHNFLSDQPGACLSPNPNGTSGHAKDGHHNTFWPLRVHQHVIWLRNAAQTFQRFMAQVLQDLPFTYDYIDDILFVSTTKEEHLVHLREICRRLDAHGIVVNPDKCVLGVPELDFLGHRVNKHGVCPLEETVDIIR